MGAKTQGEVLWLLCSPKGVHQYARHIQRIQWISSFISLLTMKSDDAWNWPKTKTSLLSVTQKNQRFLLLTNITGNLCTWQMSKYITKISRNYILKLEGGSKQPWRMNAYSSWCSQRALFWISRDFIGNLSLMKKERNSHPENLSLLKKFQQENLKTVYETQLVFSGQGRTKSALMYSH